ncbi:BREX-2 system adenine-specific DNA-methyltransferase PglX [Sorangium sp. So ce1153]|uniref:BREX-2 system adenine-specific DNA-methyltransferase PglX n=1 Tax=Sorangium sp. So ce1153 TaxID=3133333 RepID=UPI003F61123A
MVARRKNTQKGTAELEGQSDPRAPLDSKRLVETARPVLLRLAEDLLARAKASPAVTAALEARHKVEQEQRRTADPFPVWQMNIVDQVAAAWFLSCVFVRVLEDRGLISQARLAGPGAADSQRQFFDLAPSLAEREYLLTVFRELSRFPAARDLFDTKHNPVWLLTPSAEAAKALLAMFRLPKAEAPAFRFGQADTNFLGNLYQDLNEAVKQRYALLQTPHFVQSFILDRTLERAIERFGLDDTTVIDPTCGSGHFLLGAFARLYDHRLRKEPALGQREAARKALDAVYGVDINSYAVAIARFRLTLAYLEKAGFNRLADAPALPLHLVVADSLLHNAQLAQASFLELEGQSPAAWEGQAYALEDEAAARDVLYRRYAAVVGNPPYITVKDKVLRDRYREYYCSAFREYSLGAVFTERFFQLAREGGRIGMITANSFMKREFGKKLIEQYLPTVNLDLVVNTEGAYIPWHGTPTVLLFGAAEEARGSDILTVLGKRGEPTTPENGEHGVVWRSIAEHWSEVGFENDYISVATVARTSLEKHPWSLGGGGAAEVKALLEERAMARLQNAVEAIGFVCMTRADDVYFVPRKALHRAGIRDEYIIENVEGDVVRDWSIDHANTALFPYDESLLPTKDTAVLRFLWPYRTQLWLRREPNGNHRELGLTWWEWSRFQRERYRAPLKIAFAFVASHNHFVLDRGGKAFKQSAPIIKLPDAATENDHLMLLAYLNSSTACFWMKQVSHNKGASAYNRSTQDEPARIAFEFTGTQLAELPLLQGGNRTDLSSRLILLASTITKLAGERVSILRMAGELRNGLSRTGSIKDVVATLRGRDLRLLEHMVWLQEELDWTVYCAFGLCAADLLCDVSPDEHSWQRCPLGTRPFEVLAARGGQTVGIDGQDLSSTFPTDWPESVRRLWELRLEAIATSQILQCIEAPSYKRRWLITLRESAGRVETFEDRLAVLVQFVAVEELERHIKDHSPAAVIRRSEFVAAARPVEPLLDVIREQAAITLEKFLHDQSVPFLALYRFNARGMEKRTLWEQCWSEQRREDALGTPTEIVPPPRYDPTDYADLRFWQLRGKVDLSKEPFISYPGCESDQDGEPVYGWTGWNHLQQAQALAALYQKRKTEEAWGADRLTPMLAGLLELLPWIKQWHNEPSDEYGGMRLGEFFEGYLDGECRGLGLTRDDLRAWRPAAKKRGKAGGRAKKAEPMMTEEGAEDG